MKPFLVWKIFKLVNDHLLESVESLPAQDGETHDVAAVPLGVELQQSLPHINTKAGWLGPETLLVSDGELAKVVEGIAGGAVELVQSPVIHGEV